VGKKMNAYRLLLKPEGKRPLGRPRRKWIKIDLGEMRWGLVWLRIGTGGELL
jgi:hypothetical protein